MSYQADTTRMESTAQVLYETRSASSPTSEKGMMDDKKDLDAVGVSVTAPDHSNDSELEVVLDEAAIEAAGQSAGASAYVWMLTIFAGIGGALFGYDTGTISSVLVQINDDITPGRDLRDGEKEFITSSLLLGALLAALISGNLADIIGRKWVIAIADMLFIVGAIMQAASTSIWHMMIPGRFVMGWGVGAAACIVPMYIQELSPAKQRGRLTTFNSVCITGGQVVAYAIGAAFENVSSGWRWIIAIGAIPPIIQCIAIHFFFPESPRHLVKLGRNDEAAAAMTKMYPLASQDQIQKKVDVLQRHIHAETAEPWLTRFGHVFNDGPTRRAVLICSLLMAAQQLSGFNTLMYYSATIFQYAGLKSPTAVGLVVSGTNCLWTLVAVKYVDRIGRRRILLYSIPVAIGGLIFASIVFRVMTNDTNQRLLEGYDYSKTLSSLMIVAMVVFISGYATGLGNVPWNQGEFFDQAHRGIGTSISTAVCWSCNLVIAQTFLRLMNAITPAGAFGLYGGLTAFWYILIVFCFPEISGMSLEEVRMILSSGFGVRKSLRLRREKLALWKEEKRTAEQLAALQNGTDMPSAV